MVMNVHFCDPYSFAGKEVLYIIKDIFTPMEAHRHVPVVGRDFFKKKAPGRAVTPSKSNASHKI